MSPYESKTSPLSNLSEIKAESKPYDVSETFLFPACRRSIFGYLCHCNLSAMLTHPSVSVRYIARDSNSLHANASEEGFRPRGIAVDPPKCETSPGVSHSK